MLIIPGQRGKDFCDRNVGLTRREWMRVGAIGLGGLTLPQLLALQARATPSAMPVRAKVDASRFAFSVSVTSTVCAGALAVEAFSK